MSQEQGGVENGPALLNEVRELVRRDVAGLRSQLAEAQERLNAASAESASMRAGRDQSRQGQVAAEVRVMQLQKEIATLTQTALDREREYAHRDEGWTEKLFVAQKEANSTRMELGRTADKLAMTEAMVRNAQNQITQYEAAQRAQMARLGELAPKAAQLEQTVQQQQQLIEQMKADSARVAAEYEEQARKFLKEKNDAIARLSELATARSRRLLMKLGLVSRCHWEK